MTHWNAGLKCLDCKRKLRQPSDRRKRRLRCAMCSMKKHRLSALNYVKRNRVAFNIKTRSRRLEIKLETIKHYGGKCACCGESRHQFLAIDHIHGGGRRHCESLGLRGLRGWHKKNNFPSGFRVLCHNCNMAIGFYGSCPHKEKTHAAPASRIA